MLGVKVGRAYFLDHGGSEKYWIVDAIKSPDVSLKIEAIDHAGNLACNIHNIKLDTVVDLLSFNIDQYFLSPNEDGVMDNITIDFTADETVSADLLILDNQGMHNDYKNLSIVRTLLRNQQVGSGDTGLAIWDGRNDLGEIVQDGKYEAYLILTDSCGNQRAGTIGHGSTGIVVDNTPPEASITYPVTGALTGNTVEITGTANDLNFDKYFLGGSSIDINYDDIKRIEKNTLGTFNANGKEGLYTITLDVYDKAGNTSTTTTEFQVVLGNILIIDFNLSPKLFSPNADGKKDQVALQYKLNPEITIPLNVNLSILDQNQRVIQNLEQISITSGTINTISWNGLDSSGVLAPDGKYVLALKAYYPESPEVFQIEHLTVQLDSTPPEIGMTFPLPNGYFPDNPLNIIGSIYDEHLTEYELILSGESGSEVIDTGMENRDSYTFGNLYDLAEGSYTLSVKATDQGEIFTTSDIPFTLDRTAPEVLLTSPTNGLIFGGSEQSDIDIAGSINEQNLAEWLLEYTRKEEQANWLTLASGNSLSTDNITNVLKAGNGGNLIDGTYLIRLSAIDQVGLSGQQTLEIGIDNTPPVLSITTPGDSVVVTKPMDILGTADDLNLREYILALSPGNCVTAYEWSPIGGGTKAVVENTLGRWRRIPAEGEYCLKLEAVDQLGNAAETTVNLRVDTLPPAPPLLTGHLQDGNLAQLSWSGNTETDLAGYSLYRDGQKLNDTLLIATEYTDPDLAEGGYGWRVTAVDQAGQESEPSPEVRLTVDLSPPEAKIAVPADHSTVADLLTIKGTAYSLDDFNEYRLFVGTGAAPINWQLLRHNPLPVSYGELGQWDTAGLADGVYSLKLEAEDLGGNIAVSQTTVTLDNQPPDAPVLTEVTPRGPLSSDVDISWHPNSESDLAGYLLYRNDELANVPTMVTGNLKPYLLNVTSFEDLKLPDGSFEYYLQAMEQAGNTSEPSNTMVVSIDTHPPQMLIVNPIDGGQFEHTLMVKGESPDLDLALVQFQFKDSTDSNWLDLGAAVATPPYLVYLDPAAKQLSYGYFNLRAVAIDVAANIDPAPQEITVEYTDLSPPAAPEGLKTVTTGDNIDLSWHPNRESDLAGYNLYRVAGDTRTILNTSLIATVTYSDKTLADGNYVYDVTAVDTYGNESPPSNQAEALVYRPLLEQTVSPVSSPEINVTGDNAKSGDLVELFDDIGSGPISFGTVIADQDGSFSFGINLLPGNNRITCMAKDASGNISKDSIPVEIIFDETPAIPTGLTGQAVGYDVDLHWNANSEPDLAGYHLFRDGEEIKDLLPINYGTPYASYGSSQAGLAFDSNGDTSWYGYFFSSGYWGINFGDVAHPVKKIEIDWINGNAPENFTVRVGTGDTDQTISSFTSNGLAQHVIELNQPISANWLEIYISYPPFYQSVSLAEVRIFEEIPKLLPDPQYTDITLIDGTYNYQVSAIDNLGLESQPCPVIEVPVGDVTPPLPPTNLTAAAKGSEVILNWDASKEADLAGYNLYRFEQQDWSKLNSEPLMTTIFTDPDLANGAYIYRVTALDAINNESEPSQPATAIVNIPLPAPPLSLTVTPIPEGSALKVCWQSVTGAATYKVYRAEITGGPYNGVTNIPASDTCTIDTGLINGTTYYYALSSTNTTGQEGALSMEALGVPTDIVPPEAPYFLTPVESGGEVESASQIISISGLSEPNNQVELSLNGIPIAQVTSENPSSHLFYPDPSSNEYVWDEGISPDGKLAVFPYSHDNEVGIGVYNLNGQKYSQIPLVGWSDVIVRYWSPDSSKATLVLWDANFDEYNAVYDFAARELNLLTPDPDKFCGKPLEWSPDSNKLACQNYDWINDAYRVIVHDLQTGEADYVSPGYTDYLFQEWSSDSARISFRFRDTENNQRIAIYNVREKVLREVPFPADSTWCNTPRLSADFSRVAYEYDDLDYMPRVSVYDEGTNTMAGVAHPGSIEEYFEGWSPAGNSCFIDYYDAADEYHGIIFDADSGIFHEVPLPEGWEGYFRGWSPDGRKAIFEQYSSLVDNWYDYIYDLGTKNLLPIDSVPPTFDDPVIWLPDSSGFITALYSPGTDDMEVYRKDLDSGKFLKTAIPYRAFDWGFDFSPNGRRIYWVIDDILSIHDIATDLTSTGPAGLNLIEAWSPDNRRLLLRDDLNDDFPLWQASADDLAGAFIVDNGASWQYDLRWLPDGRIAYLNEDDEVVQRFPGGFLFPAVELQPGANLFEAIATDESGNVSPKSEPITVNLGSDALTDPEVTADDLFIMPLAPNVGEQVLIEIAIRNNSGITARNLGIDIYLQQPDGILMQLESGSLPELAGNQALYLDYTWDSFGNQGINKLFVVLDPDNRIPEKDENNNFAVLAFPVSEAPGLSMEATLNRENFTADDVLNLELAIANSGPLTPILVNTTIEDSNGYPVTELPVIDTTLPYGGVDNELLAWPVGATFAGDYQVRVKLADGDGTIIDEQLLPFTILPDLKFRALLSTDRLHYGPGESVSLKARVENLSINYNAPNLEARLTITSADGQLFRDNAHLATLYNGSAAELGHSWNTGINPPGTCQALLTIYLDNQQVAFGSLEFIIDPVLELTGQLQIEPKVLPQDQTVQVEYGVQSRGNIGSAALDCELTLSDSSGRQLAARTLNFELAANANTSGQVTFSDLLPIGAYRLALYHLEPTGLRYLAGETFSVIDTSPPHLEIIAPAAGVFHRDLDLSVKAADDSGPVAKVEYRLASANWRPLPLVDPSTGLYGTNWQPTAADEGDHLLEFRAMDLAGNLTTPLAVNITLAPRVDLRLNLDSAQYRLNEILNGTVTMANQGWAKTVDLSLLVEDINGVVLADLSPGTTNLTTDEIRNLAISWPVGATLAGDYLVKAKLSKGCEILSEATATFTILPTLALETVVSSDRPDYGLNEQVLLLGNLASQGNYPLTNLTARLIVSDGTGDILHQAESAIAGLAPGTTTSPSFSWNTGRHRAGNCQVELALIEGQNVLARAVTSLIIRPELALTGYIATPNLQIRQNEDFVLDWAAVNLGNHLAEHPPLSLSIYSESGETVATAPIIINLDIDQEISGRETISATGLPLGHYRAALEYLLESGIIELASCPVEIIDNTPPDLQMLAPLSGSIFDGPFELTVIASDSESGLGLVEYRVDGSAWLALPLIDQSADLYSLTWEPIPADEGIRLLEFRASDLAGNISETVSSEITIELCRPFYELSGSLTYTPQPLYLGEQAGFHYSLSNSCSKALNGLKVELQLADAARETIATSVTTINLGPEAEQGGEFNIDTLTLNRGSYLASLEVASADEPNERRLTEVNLEILPPLEFSLTPLDRADLLVWLNYAAGDFCPEPEASGHDHDGDDDDGDQHSHNNSDEDDDHDRDFAVNASCKSSDEDNAKTVPPCVERQKLASTLAAATDGIRIVESREEFEEELRNPLYSDFLILGDQYQLTDHLTWELREKVHAGAGLVTSGWLPAGTPEREALLGVAYSGQRPDAPVLVQTAAGILGTPLDLPVLGRQWLVSATGASRILGWFSSSVPSQSSESSDDDHHRNASSKKSGDNNAEDSDKPPQAPDPALLLNEFGLGRTLYLAFDYGMSLNGSSAAPHGELINLALAYLHGPRPYAGLLPFDPASMLLSVTSPGRAFDLQLTGNCQDGLAGYDPVGGIRGEAGVCLDAPLALSAGGTGSLPFYLLPPRPAPEYYFNLEADAVINGAGLPLQSARFSLPAGLGRVDLVAMIETQLDQLPVGRRERGKLNNVRKYLDKVEQRIVGCEPDHLKNIEDLIHAVDSLLDISCCETRPVRLLLDDLLRREEAGWYFYEGLPCQDREGDRDDD